MHVLHRSCTRFIIEHIKHFTKILGLIHRPTIPYKEEHDTIRMILGLNIFIHPYLTQDINGLNAKPLTHAMSKPNSTSDIRDAHDLTYMDHIVSGLKRLNLTWAFTSPRNIWAFEHPVPPGLPIHGPVCPGLSFCDADSGDSSTTAVWAVEVQTATNLRGGS
nr:AC5 [Sri Lankan cassava mosaic virus]UYW66206.1 AC5 [Sri Lankan cassava mosaic virus]UZC82067.1 AC5 [Sri Lankan cassava mosaic virus]